MASHKWLKLLAYTFALLAFFSPTSNSAGIGLALSGSGDPALRVAWRFDLQTKALVGSPIKITIPAGSIQQCAVSPNGKLAYISTYDNFLNVLNFTGTTTTTVMKPLTIGVKGPEHIEVIKFSPSGNLLALCGTTFIGGVDPKGYLSVYNLTSGKTTTVGVAGEFCATTTFCDDSTLISSYSHSTGSWSIVSSYKYAKNVWTQAASIKWTMAIDNEPPNHLSCSQGFAIATNFAPSSLISLSVPSLKVVSTFSFIKSKAIKGLVEPLAKVYSLSTVIGDLKGQIFLRNNASVVVFPYKLGIIGTPTFAAPLPCPGCVMSLGYPYGLSNAAGAVARFSNTVFTGGNFNQLVSLDLSAPVLKLANATRLNAPTNAIRSLCAQN